MSKKRKHVPLSQVTLENIGDVFSYVNVGGKLRIIRSVPTSFDRKALTLEFMTPEDFMKAFVNKKKLVRVEAPSDPADELNFDAPAAKSKLVPMSIASLFLNNPNRMTYDRLVFEADKRIYQPTDFNMWQGFTVEPEFGDWELTERMILESLANGDKESFAYIIRWVAWCLQNPTKRAEAAIVFRSDKQGTGKGLLGNSLCKLFGAHAAHLYRANGMAARFNSQLAMCGFLFDDESTFSGDKAAASVMKGLVTEPTIDIERKGIDVITLPNSLKIMKATNSKWAVPTEAEDRRYAIFQTSEQMANDQKYFGPVVRQMNRGGLAAMLYDLLHMSLKGWHPRSDLPDTQARADQKALSLPDADKWLLGFLESGVLTHTHKRYPNRVVKPKLFYEAAQRQSRELSFWRDEQFAKFLDGWGVIVKQSHGAYRHFPPLADLRAEFVKKYAWYKGFAGAAVRKWTTDADETHDDYEEFG